MPNASVIVKDLSVSVGSLRILDSLDLTLRQGMVALVVGPPGSGKSTLLKVIAGLIPEVYSLYRVCGEVSVYGLTPSEALRAGLVSYVPQDPWSFFIAMKVCDELELSRVPVNGFRGLCDRDIISLSDGELYRLLTYVSLKGGAKLVLIDEPSSHLDSQALTDLLEGLRELCLKYGVTVVLADHNVDLLSNYADVLIELGSGSDGDSRAGYVPLVSSRAVGNYVILAEGLTFTYGSKPVFEELDLTLREGEALCVLGKNGVGKTTLLKVLTGMLKPYRGYLYVRKPLFYVPQRPLYWFISGSVYDELTLYLRLHRRALDLNEVINRFMLTELSFRNPYTLSVGEARRLSLALAYISRTKLVILDEPTIGLDMYSTSLLEELVYEFSSDGRGVVIASHNELVCRVCDHVVKLPLG